MGKKTSKKTQEKTQVIAEETIVAQEAPKQEAPQAEQEAPKEKPQKESKEENFIDAEIYDDYITLKFLKLANATLKEEAVKKMQLLEEKVSKADGRKAKRTVTACVKSEMLRMVEGLPMPKKYYKTIESAGKAAEKYYLQ